MSFENRRATIRSERHNKIAGDFGEHFICYWLSKRNFQPVIVDYSGIDIVAYNMELNERWGISVKTRTRAGGTSKRKSIMIKAKELPLIEQACQFFKAKPYFGMVMDTEINNQINVHIVSFDDMKRINNYEEEKDLYIKFSETYVNQYNTAKNSINIQLKWDTEMR